MLTAAAFGPSNSWCFAAPSEHGIGLFARTRLRAGQGECAGFQSRLPSEKLSACIPPGRHRGVRRPVAAAQAAGARRVHAGRLGHAALHRYVAILRRAHTPLVDASLAHSPGP
eukprot:3150120-Prymnesium_polylepis.1